MLSLEFTYKGVTYSPGERVTVHGFAGSWTIQEFGRNPRDTNGEWCAALVDEKRRLFWPAHQLNKA